MKAIPQPLLESDETLAWQESYSVGYAAMDKQHQIMFEIINQLRASQSHPIPPAELRMIFDHAIAYSEAHFSAEEKLLAELDHAEIKDHIKAHRSYLTKISLLEKEFETGASRIDLKLYRFLSTWWQHHVLEVDQTYALKS